MLPSGERIFDHLSSHWAATSWFAILRNLQRLRPERKIGQRCKPTRALTQGPPPSGNRMFPSLHTASAWHLCAKSNLTIRGVSFAVSNRAIFAARNGPPSSQHLFATNSLHFMLREFVANKCCLLFSILARAMPRKWPYSKPLLTAPTTTGLDPVVPSTQAFTSVRAITRRHARIRRCNVRNCPFGNRFG